MNALPIDCETSHRTARVTTRIATVAAGVVLALVIGHSAFEATAVVKPAEAAIELAKERVPDPAFTGSVR